MTPVLSLMRKRDQCTSVYKLIKRRSGERERPLDGDSEGCSYVAICGLKKEKWTER